MPKLQEDYFLSGTAQMAKCRPYKLEHLHTLTDHQSPLTQPLSFFSFRFPVLLFSHIHTSTQAHINGAHSLIYFYVHPCSTVQFTVKNNRIKTAVQLLQRGLYSCCSRHLLVSSHYKSLLPCVCFFSTVTSWEVNSVGHPVELPPKVCEELLQVIEDSNSTLPPSMRRMRSYEVRQMLLTVKGRLLLRHFDPWGSYIIDASKIVFLILCLVSTEMLKSHLVYLNLF